MQTPTSACRTPYQRLQNPPSRHPGTIDAYTQFNLKPWDVAAGIVILEEAGGRVSTADGTAYSVFDRSLLASNDAM